MGDSGSGRPGQYALAGKMTAYDPDIVIHAGDVVVPSGAASEYPPKFYRPYADLIRRAAVYPCVGNHDWNDYQARPLFDAFVLPENGPPGITPERAYWFDYGDVRFAAFDSNLNFEGIRDHIVPWLDEVLAGAGDRWKIVYWHHPPYTWGKYDPAGKIRELIVPVLDRHGVHLAINGHNHMYERSHPLRGGKVVEAGEGTIYLVAGTGGDRLYKPQATEATELAVQKVGLYAFLVADVTPPKLSFQHVAISGVVDKFSIERSGDAAGPAAANALSDETSGAAGENG
jgi:3',5'-cyclic AMP phosphodiesterase CpdA